MRHLIAIVSLGLAGLAFGMGLGLSNELKAEPLSTQVTIYDCKRRLSTDTHVRCVCLQGSEPYFCNWPSPTNRWNGLNQ